MNENLKRAVNWIVDNPNNWNQEYYFFSESMGNYNITLDKSSHTIGDKCKLCIAGVAALLDEEVAAIDSSVGEITLVNGEKLCIVLWAESSIGLGIGALLIEEYSSRLYGMYMQAVTSPCEENIRGFFDSLWETYGYE